MSEQRSTVYKMIPKFGQLRDDVLFGDVWEQTDLSKRDRSLITVAALTALYRTEELRGHMELAVKNGVAKEEILRTDHPSRVLLRLAHRAECGASGPRSL